MGRRGEHNVGQLARERFGAGAYLIGFGTDRGTVAAAHGWGDPFEIMDVRPARGDSYEHLCHRTGIERFLLPLRPEGAGEAGAVHPPLLRELRNERLERAIGVIYRPRTERRSHYFHASLPDQFDEYVWIDESEAVTPIGEPAAVGAALEEVPETFPFAV